MMNSAEIQQYAVQAVNKFLSSKEGLEFLLTLNNMYSNKSAKDVVLAVYAHGTYPIELSLEEYLGAYNVSDIEASVLCAAKRFTEEEFFAFSTKRDEEFIFANQISLVNSVEDWEASQRESAFMDGEELPF